jgi:hypothetical protein
MERADAIEAGWRAENAVPVTEVAAQQEPVTFDSFDPADGTIAEKTATAADAMTELQAQREFLQKLLDCIRSK